MNTLVDRAVFCPSVEKGVPHELAGHGGGVEGRSPAGGVGRDAGIPVFGAVGYRVRARASRVLNQLAREVFSAEGRDFARGGEVVVAAAVESLTRAIAARRHSTFASRGSRRRAA